MDFTQKLALGTVQFGLHYGINNNIGKVSKDEVGSILNFCYEKNISVVDTAFAYGNSENVLGETIANQFNIVSKLPKCNSNEVKTIFAKSLNRLNVAKLYGYMIHNFDTYKKDKKIWKELLTLKEGGYIEKIGFSLYSPFELEEIWKDGILPDIIQIPFNLFDTRFEKHFPQLKTSNTEIHTRSTFLQGLFFKEIKTLPAYFDKVTSKLILLNDFCATHQINKAKCCLAFVLNHHLIDKVVIGVDSLAQLKDNIEQLSNMQEFHYDFSEYEINDLRIINPANWPQ